MKIMISTLSIGIVFLGIVPFFGEGSIIPSSGWMYNLILIGAAIVISLLAFINQLLMGPERFFMVLQSIFLVAVGVLPFMDQLIAFQLSPIMSSVIVILVGAAGLLYGIMGMG